MNLKPFSCILFLLAALCGAQSNATDGALDGYVTDPTGARVPNASIEAILEATNQRFSTTTDAEGYYRFPILRIGVYRLRIGAPNFSP
jgi:protocatechuate 3,4-dioxygenase beta subunit